MTGTDDFEQRRQARETANEWVVCWIVVATTLVLLATEFTWTIYRSHGPVSVAAAGEILVTESTRTLLGAAGVTLEPVPLAAVKGKEQPLVLHRVRLPTESAA